jgi:hypothetical protein
MVLDGTIDVPFMEGVHGTGIFRFYELNWGLYGDWEEMPPFLVEFR